MAMHGTRSVGRQESLQPSSQVALCGVTHSVRVPFLPSPVFMKDVDEHLPSLGSESCFLGDGLS